MMIQMRVEIFTLAAILKLILQNVPIFSTAPFLISWIPKQIHF